MVLTTFVSSMLFSEMTASGFVKPATACSTVTSSSTHSAPRTAPSTAPKIPSTPPKSVLRNSEPRIFSRILATISSTRISTKNTMHRAKSVMTGFATVSVTVTATSCAAVPTLPPILLVSVCAVTPLRSMSPCTKCGKDSIAFSMLSVGVRLPADSVRALSIAFSQDGCTTAL